MRKVPSGPRSRLVGALALHPTPRGADGAALLLPLPDVRSSLKGLPLLAEVFVSIPAGWHAGVLVCWSVGDSCGLGPAAGLPLSAVAAPGLPRPPIALVLPLATRHCHSPPFSLASSPASLQKNKNEILTRISLS